MLLNIKLLQLLLPIGVFLGGVRPKTASDKWKSFDVLKLSRTKYEPLKENQ